MEHKRFLLLLHTMCTLLLIFVMCVCMTEKSDLVTKETFFVRNECLIENERYQLCTLNVEEI